MKNEIVFLIDDFVNKYQDWDGDIIDLTDEDKDVLCYEWLTAYPSWLDDTIPACIHGTQSQIEFLDMLYSKGADAVSLRLKDAIYLYLESGLRERVQDHFCEAHMKAEPFAGYGRGE
jgi:hypothetical protein